MGMSADSSALPYIRIRGRSFMGLVLAPERPVASWLAGLDAQMARSPQFFEARPVVLDVSTLGGTEAELTGLTDALESRGIRLIGVEGADTTWSGFDTWGRTPLIASGRPDRWLEVREEPQAQAATPAPAAPPAPSGSPSLLVDRPVRSGQSVVFDRGDVVILGSVASGAEIVAGGSIHVYGTLRGRAIAGMLGREGTRIFCHKLDAELLAIDGLYRTADDIGPALRGRAVQAWLEDEAMVVAPLD